MPDGRVGLMGVGDGYVRTRLGTEGIRARPADRSLGPRWLTDGWGRRESVTYVEGGCAPKRMGHLVF
jgi:hypothetical protein